MEVPPKIHKEIQNCKNSHCLEELKDKLHIFDNKIDGFNYGYPYINGKKKYARIIIRNKKI